MKVKEENRMWEKLTTYGIRWGWIGLIGLAGFFMLHYGA